jgi:hypothetical protein
MGHADTYTHGDHNGLCDRCGFKFKFSELRKTWDGLYVCHKDWEPRQPQDMVRGLPDKQTVPVSRPEGTDTFLSTNEVTVDSL